MTDLKILEQLQSMMQELFDIDVERVVPSAQLIADLELDSIDAIDMVVKLQQMTGRRVSEQELKSLHTVGDVVDLVRAYLQPAS